MNLLTLGVTSIVVVLSLLTRSHAQELWVSPCPRLFSYEPPKENDRWFGVVTLISETDLKGVWLRVAFDRPSIQLGNWFGEIRTSDNMEYLIHNRNHELKANMPYALRFYIKYNPGETPPQLTGIRLNARPVCPEGQTTTPAAITGGFQLITSAPDGKNPLGGISQVSVSTTPTPSTTTQRRDGGQTFSRPGGGWSRPQPSSSEDDDDDVFQGDFQLISRPHLRPQAEPECGTVVMAHARRTRRDAWGGGGAHTNRRQTRFQHSDDYHDHAHNIHQAIGQTPNFPQIEYFQIQQGVEVPTVQFWGLRDWILNFLSQKYQPHGQTISPESFTPPQNGDSFTTSPPAPEFTSTKNPTTPSEILTTPTKFSTTPSEILTTARPIVPYVGGPNDIAEFNHTHFNQLTPIPMNPDQEVLLANRSMFGSQGIATLEQQPRPLITFGQSTKEGEFPWHVALYHERGADLQYICGASLISRSHVITVAHCVTRRRSATPLNPDSLVVYLGKYYLKKWGNPGIQDSQVSAIIPHPEYNSQTYANDIALLRLTNSVTFTDYVRPICLWGDGNDLSNVLDKPGTVVGWGFDHTGKVTEELTQAKMPVVTKETCIYSFPDFFSRFTTSKTYCAGFRNGTSVCNGDSGGGMVFPKPTSTPGREVWQLRGLVSISVALQNQFKCDSSHYVVFTDVAKYLDWIHASMRN